MCEIYAYTVNCHLRNQIISPSRLDNIAQFYEWTERNTPSLAMGTVKEVGIQNRSSKFSDVIQRCSGHLSKEEGGKGKVRCSLECKVCLPAWESAERDRWRGEGTCRLVKGDVRKWRTAYRAVRCDVALPAPSVTAGLAWSRKTSSLSFRARVKY